MFMKKLLLLLFVYFLLITTCVKAQTNDVGADYNTALGIKFYPTGVTLKHFVTSKNALEGLGYFLSYGARVTGLYEIYGNINNAGALKWYVGPGAHLAFYNANNGSGTALGIDAVLGLDYKIGSVPLDISFDWQPSVEFGNFKNHGFGGNWGGIGFRYTF